MKTNRLTKTIIPQIEGVYSSFPTFTEYDSRIFVFYRQGFKSDMQCHGIAGKVKCFEIEKDLFGKVFDDEKLETLYELGKDYIVFESNNEIDAIVSRLDENVFSLGTRGYIKGKPGKTYISFSDKPVFKDRYEVKIKGVNGFAFYGKAFKWQEGYVFPAHGELKEDTFSRPLLLITDDFSSWDLLSYLPSYLTGTILNESSVVFDGEKYFIFMREDLEPFGIWYSISDDLQEWSFPKKLLSSAHAPMCIYKDGRIYLTFRDLVSTELSSVSLYIPFQNPEILTIDTYEGNPYDGGYTDICVIDSDVYITYYLGNGEGEPFIKTCRIG